MVGAIIERGTLQPTESTPPQIILDYPPPLSQLEGGWSTWEGEGGRTVISPSPTFLAPREVLEWGGGAVCEVFEKIKQDIPLTFCQITFSEKIKPDISLIFCQITFLWENQTRCPSYILPDNFFQRKSNQTSPSYSTRSLFFEKIKQDVPLIFCQITFFRENKTRHPPHILPDHFS